ncbi:MAG: BON domain-containing protein [Planctomycetaceae bacterium]|nr:BON domain-containing protein [Planctomycetaceae bacterium]
MRRYGKWILTLGLLAATPGVAPAQNQGDPFTGSGGAAAAKPSNQQVAEQIAETLRAARLNGYDIEIECRNGVATLGGMVSDAGQKARATQLVSQVPGVLRVDNRLQVPGATGGVRQAAAFPTDQAGGQIQQVGAQFPGSPSQAGQPDNQQIAEKIAEALQAAKLSGYDVEIRYQNGVCLLTGSVATAEQKEAATANTRQVPGVLRVDNRLQVAGAAARPAPRQTASRVNPAAYQGQPPMPPMPPAGYQGGPPMPPGAGYPGGGYPGAGIGGPPAPAYGHAGAGNAGTVFNNPNLPQSAWPTTAKYPNYAAVSYPSQYSASAFPYIGPFYPYPQVPMGWRQAQLEWDDGFWKLNFRSRTDRWWWFMHPKNW